VLILLNLNPDRADRLESPCGFLSADLQAAANAARSLTEERQLRLQASLRVFEWI